MSDYDEAESRLRDRLALNHPQSLKQEAAEPQDAEDDYYRDNDEFDQRHCHTLRTAASLFATIQCVNRVMTRIVRIHKI